MIDNNVLHAHSEQIDALLKLEGFQLPTVSAVLHYCHPNAFPIVDVNVEAACALLKEQHEMDFVNLNKPTLPASNTSVKNKKGKYLAFIVFINSTWLR